MNSELFDELMIEKPEQNQSEWEMFLEICEMYLTKNGIKKPIVVELGVYSNRQKSFWTQLFGAEHIGIDISRKYRPDIHGNTHSPETLEKLKKRLNGRSIDILFIDANHAYSHVKDDFKLYSPLCNDIIAFHDTELRKRGVGKFWDELKIRYKDFLFLSIYQHRESRIQMGIGMMIKK